MVFPFSRGAALGILALAAAVLLMAAACADGGGAGSTPLATSPVAGGNETAAPTSGSMVDVVTDYVTKTGLDGATFQTTYPINCKAFADPEDPQREAAMGKICINFISARFTRTDGVIDVEKVGTEASWEISMEVGEGGWVVTGAKAKGQ